MPKPTGAQIIGALLKRAGQGVGQYYRSKEEAAQAEEEKKSQDIRDAYTFALTQRLNAEQDEAAIQKRILENIAHSYRQPHAAKLGSAPILSTKLEEARQRIKTRQQRGVEAPAPTYRPDLLKAMATDPAALVQGSQALKNFKTLIESARATGAFPKEKEKIKPLTTTDKRYVWDELKTLLGEDRFGDLDPEELTVEYNALGQQRFPKKWIDMPVPLIKTLKKKWWGMDFMAADKKVPTFVPQDVKTQVRNLLPDATDEEIEEAMRGE